ncbi:MAG: dihydroorotate dehydrogenase [Candidatus Magasanikbacteria bacterium]|nr:dihydroorotate dehydrogenase [Candidatus Magasanikbacteria bacterium]
MILKNQEPIYHIEKSYQENFSKGPFFSGKIPQRIKPQKEKWIDFFGYKIASPLGVPAGPLLNSKWTTLAANLGFDVVTYKTIRSRAHACQPLPNCVYVNTNGSLNKKRLEETLEQKDSEPTNMENLAITNSFGMPSSGTLSLLKDIEKANKSLQEGQIMIVSTVGTPRSEEDFISDFVRTVALAKEAGAKIIEANFSCPNVATGEGSIYTDPDYVYTIARSLVKELKEIPLIIKVGIFTNLEKMRQVFYAVAKAGARGICGINTIGMAVQNKYGKPALGPNRLKSGICGAPIHKAAIEFVKYGRTIIDNEKLGLTLLGTGGVTTPQGFSNLLEAGADIAMSATGMMWNPYLANKYHQISSTKS